MTTDQLNRPLKDLRVSVIDACNFRCNYCMPPDSFPENHRFLKPHQRLNWDDLIPIIKSSENLGVQKIRITGGEPLLRRDLNEFIFRIREETQIKDIAITTNGYYLEECIEDLLNAGLSRVTVSLDSLDEKNLEKINHKKDALERILKGIEKAHSLGIRPIKINTVVQKGVNDHEVVDLTRYFNRDGFHIRFIEFMDVGTMNRWNIEHVVPSKELRNRIAKEINLTPENPNYHGEVAKNYQTSEGATVGFISSISDPFCSSCTRGRITCEGFFYTCLFAAKGLDLKPFLHQGEKAIQENILKYWQNRNDQYSMDRKLNKQELEKIEMYHMGG